MINKKNTVLFLATIVIAGSLLTVSRPAYAASGDFWGGNFFSGLIQYIAQKFGLDKTKVQTAVNDYQQQKKATITPRPTMSPQDRQTAEKKRLDPFVTQGKITADQENAIIAELETVRTKYKLDSNLTSDQRKTEMQNMQNDLKSWAQSQGIDSTYVLPMFGPGRGGGNGFRGRRGPGPTITP